LQEDPATLEMLDMRSDEPWIWGAHIVLSMGLSGEIWCVGDEYDPEKPSEETVVKATVHP
jgi:hypothetical protein